MKFSVDKHYFVEPLNKVATALPSKETIPILSGILFVADQNGLSMTAGNGQVYIRATIDIDNLEINNHGRIVLPGDKVAEIARKAGADITVEAKGLDVTIKSGANKFKLTGIDTEDYPDIPAFESEIITLPVKSFKRLIRKTVFAASDNKTAAPMLNGVQFKFLDGKIRAVATNRHRLSKAEEQRTENASEIGSEISTVISKDSLQTFLKTAPDNEDIDFYFGEYGFMAVIKGFTFYSRVLEGTYPDVERIIQNTVATAQFNTKDMISALENAEIIVREGKIHGVKLTLSDVFIIESKSSDGNANVSVDVHNATGERGMAVFFNVKYVIEALKVIESEKTCISLGRASEPVFFTGVDDPNSFHLVLPYRVAE